MDKTDFYDLLAAVPKAELHLHGEATVGENAIKRFYKTRFQKDMPDEEYAGLFTYDDLGGFLNSFIKIQNFFVNIDDLAYVFADFDAYLEKNNIVYCETFFAPTSLMRNGFSFAGMTDSISAAIRRNREERNRTVKVLVDVSRSFGLENAQHNLDLVLEARNPDIIGIGLGGAEDKGPAKDYIPVFQRAKEAGLHRVAHAGENCGSWSIRDAISGLCAERIGHGISAAYDEDFLRELAEKQVPLEVCPTSNTFTRHYVRTLADHPIRKLYDAGVFVTLNTDDPTFFKVSLIDEYWNIYSELHFTLEEIKQIILNGFRAAFLSAEEKERYCAEAEKAWADWFAAHPQAR